MQTAIYVSTWHPHIGIGVHEVRQRTVELMVAQRSAGAFLCFTVPTLLVPVAEKPRELLHRKGQNCVCAVLCGLVTFTDAGVKK